MSTAVKRAPTGAMRPDDVRYIDEVDTGVREALADIARSMDAPLRDALGDPQGVVEAVVRSLPRTSAWGHRLGPVYTGSSLARAMKVSRQTVSERADKRTLISVRTGDGHVVFPSFQFDAHFVPKPPLIAAWRVLRDVADDLTAASWLFVEHSALGHRSAARYLDESGDAEAVLRLARGTAARWTR